ncbi:MAG: hypothetical protein ACYC6C_04455, partial [Coriobacteriia bacterium]
HGADEIGELTRAMESMRDSVVARVDTLRELAGVVLVTAEGVQGAAVSARNEVEGVAAGEMREVEQRIDDVVTHAATLENLALQMLAD